MTPNKIGRTKLELLYVPLRCGVGVAFPGFPAQRDWRFGYAYSPRLHSPRPVLSNIIGIRTTISLRGYDTPRERSGQMGNDQISFYDESLKKQIEGSFVSDGKS